MDFLKLDKNEQKSAETVGDFLKEANSKSRESFQKYYFFIAFGQEKNLPADEQKGSEIINRQEIKDFMISKYPVFSDADVKFIFKQDGWAIPFIGEIRADGVETDFQQLFGSIAMFLHEKEGIEMEAINNGYKISMQQPLVFPDPQKRMVTIGFPIEMN